MDPTQRRTRSEDHRRSHRLRIQRRKPDDPKVSPITPRLDWRFKRTAGPPYNAKIFDQDGNQKVDANGKPMTRPSNADSNLRSRKWQPQVNLWCWPCGSGQLWSFHKSEDPVCGKEPCQGKRRQTGRTVERNENHHERRNRLRRPQRKTVLDKSKMPGVETRVP